MNLAELYGFFRPGLTEPKDLFARWPAVLAALVLSSFVIVCEPWIANPAAGQSRSNPPP